MAFRGLDGGRCSLQGFYASSSICPALPTADPAGTAVTADPTADECAGPFDGFPQCENKIVTAIAKRDSAWMAFRGLDGGRCSLQGFYASSSICPALPTADPIADPTADPAGTAVTADPTADECAGPFDGFPQCENKIV